MKFYNYLKEKDILDVSYDISDLNDKIQQNCKQYLRLIQGKDPLFRGMDMDDHYGKKKVRKNRMSQGMSDELFKEFNKWLEKNGHNRRDKSISVITDPEHAETFGRAYYVFPLDKMSYSFVKAMDINMDDPRTDWSPNLLRQHLNVSEENNRDLGSFFFTDKGFDKAYKNNFEIWINSDSYYYISAPFLKGIAKWDQNKQRFVM